MKIVVAITGASGAVLGQRLLENLTDHEVHLIVSKAGEQVIALELGEGAHLPATARYSPHDFAAPLASSSFLINAMVIVPCSLKTLAAIAHGYASDLIVRAAENVLRSGRKLIVVPRETPLSLSAIENMRSLKLAGAVVLPPVIAYYFQPRTVDEITDFFVGKILDALGLEHQLYRRWGV
ncbi:MAG: UbiX family flavin prenyltransferase [Anaerolineae bacterium]